MYDVARAAGVSQSSVSNAYNRPEKLSEAQRAHIFARAKDLGYAGPDPSARSLRTGRTGAWGLMINERLAFAFDDPTTLMLLRGISSVCDELDVSLSLLAVPGAVQSDRELRDRKMRIVRDAHVDAFMAYFMPEDSPVLDAARARNLPMINIDSPRIDGAGFVGIDDYAAAQMSARHLLDMGHRQIVVFADRLNPEPYKGFVGDARLAGARDVIARDRVRGFLDTFAAAGLGDDDVQVFEAGGYTPGVARTAAGELLDTGVCTAIAALSDTLALAALSEMADRGIAVPEEMSIIGMDGIPESAKANLTTIRQPLVGKGKRAAEMLVALQDDGMPVHELMDVYLTERGSVRKLG